MRGLILHTEQALQFAQQLKLLQGFATVQLPAKSIGVETAHLVYAILILEPAFLQSNVERDDFLDEILAKSTEDDFFLIPVLWQDCNWEESMYSGLPFFPEDKVPIHSLGDVAQQSSLAELQKKLQQLDARLQFKRENPKAFARQEQKAAKKAQKGSFWMSAMKLSWRILPARSKWAIRIVAIGGTAALSYFLFG